MSEYAIQVDWQEEFERGTWRQTGQDTMREFYEKHPSEAKKDGHDVEGRGRGMKVKYLDDVIDGWFPMMNYAYPLQTTPSEDDIIKVCRETSLTVAYNDDEDAYYLALCGGGMDLSQSIARAYQIIERWLPTSLLTEVMTQPEFSVRGQNWLDMANLIREQIQMEIRRFQQADTEWEKSIAEYQSKHQG